MNLKTIETDTGTIVIKPNRVEVKLKAYTVLDKTAMLEYLKVFKEYLAFDKYVFVIDASPEMWSITRDALVLLIRDEFVISRTIAQILIVPNLGVRLLANFYLNMVSPEVVVKTVKTHEDAENWLQDISEMNYLNTLAS